MAKIEIWRELKRRKSDAKLFLSLIGKPERTTANSVGYIHSIVANVTIHHQETDGAKNYHTCDGFDVAFSEAIRENFQALANQALAKIEDKVRLAAIDAQEEVRSMQAEIDAAQQVQS